MTETINIPYKGAELEIGYYYQPREENPLVPEETTIEGVILKVGDSEIDLSDVISQDNILDLMAKNRLDK